MVNAQRTAIQSLWHGLCTVYVKSQDATPDPATGRTRFTEEAVEIDVPCRLSFSNITEAVPDSGAAKVTQTVKLFLDPAITLPPGSKLVVTQNGNTGEYAQSGEPAVYQNHKEIPLKLFERWA